MVLDSARTNVLNNYGNEILFLVLIIRMEYFVYLLECCDNSSYVGVTNNLTRRMREHQEGVNSSCYTYSRRPVKIKYYLNFDNINDAIQIEKKLKKWSRAKKEAFFKKDWKTLHEKAKCKNATSHEYNSKKLGRAKSRPDN